jgi:RHS repeat-associated protein
MRNTEAPSGVLSTTRFYYDGQGNQVKHVDPDGSYTLYFFGIYEVHMSGSTETDTLYYPAAGAMRITIGTTSTVYYTLGDQLGSTSVVVNSSGTIVGTQGYYPFGETRYSTNTIITDRLFTSQQAIASLGLYNYKARYYSPTLGRFLSADTLTPGGPEGLNRYAYVGNDPINFSDPSGHMPADEECGVMYCKQTKSEVDPPYIPLPSAPPSSEVSSNPPNNNPPIITSDPFSPEVKIYLDGIFNPYIGPGYTSGQRSIDLTQWMGIYDLYESEEIDIDYFASHRKPNPLKYEDINSLGGEETISLIIRASYTPYTLFLDELKIPNTVNDFPNFEPFYLDALMKHFPRSVDRAKLQYLSYYPNEVYEGILNFKPSVAGD